MRNTSHAENVLVNTKYLIINTFLKNIVYLLLKSLFKYNIHESVQITKDNSMDFYKWGHLCNQCPTWEIGCYQNPWGPHMHPLSYFPISSRELLFWLLTQQVSFPSVWILCIWNYTGYTLHDGFFCSLLWLWVYPHNCIFPKHLFYVFFFF